MGKTDVLERVAVDLARGHTQPAIQRLGSLVAAHPTDLDLRRRLAAVHRMVGNAIEAGRWSYLEPDAEPAEISAFERAYPSSAVRLRELRWPGRASLAATGYARQCLEDLSAEAPAGTPAEVSGPLRRFRVGIIFALTALVSAVFVVIGAVTVGQWIF